MENTTEQTSEAPAEQSGADNPNAILSVQDLASSFMEKVEEAKSEEPTETDAVEETDATEAVESEEEQEGEVLSQSESEDEATEDLEDDEIEESDTPKGLQKALKRINQLTARAKGAEEEVALLKSEIQSLQSQTNKSSDQPDAKPALNKITNLADLETLRKEALSAKKWALSNLGRSEVVEVDGKEYDDDDIRNILTEAEEYLTEGIPQRAQFLQQKQQWVNDTIQTFPWTEKGEGEEWQTFLSIRGNEQYKTLLDSIPHGDYVTGLLVEGIKSVQARQAKSKAKPKTKAKTPPLADLADAVAPPAEDKKIRQEKKKEAILGKGAISAKQFAQYLNI
jgi:hypothetical protein